MSWGLNRKAAMNGWLVVWNMAFMTFQKQLGISSSQLTNSIIIQRGWLKPPSRWRFHGDTVGCRAVTMALYGIVYPTAGYCRIKMGVSLKIVKLQQ